MSSDPEFEAIEHSISAREKLPVGFRCSDVSDLNLGGITKFKEEVAVLQELL